MTLVVGWELSKAAQSTHPSYRPKFKFSKTEIFVIRPRPRNPGSFSLISLLGDCLHPGDDTPHCGKRQPPGGLVTRLHTNQCLSWWYRAWTVSFGIDCALLQPANRCSRDYRLIVRSKFNYTETVGHTVGRGLLLLRLVKEIKTRWSCPTIRQHRRDHGAVFGRRQPFQCFRWWWLFWWMTHG